MPSYLAAAPETKPTELVSVDSGFCTTPKITSDRGCRAKARIRSDQLERETEFRSVAAATLRSWIREIAFINLLVARLMQIHSASIAMSEKEVAYCNSPFICRILYDRLRACLKSIHTRLDHGRNAMISRGLVAIAQVWKLSKNLSSKSLIRQVRDFRCNGQVPC
jgi:hypothetical protein